MEKDEITGVIRGSTDKVSRDEKLEAPPEVQKLYRRFKAGDFADWPELYNELTELFSVSRATDVQKARLRELANRLQM